VTAPPARTRPPSGLALYVGAFLLSPLILVAWAAGCALVRVTGWPRWRMAAAAITSGALIIWFEGGPIPAVTAHFSGFLGLLSQFGRPMVHLPTPGAFLWPQIPLAVPVGLLAASFTRSRELAVPDPAAQVREQRRQVKLERKARAIAGKTAGRNFEAPGLHKSPLGVSLGGDLPPSWRSGKYVVLPDHAARLPELAIGQSGAGKSTYIARRVYLAAGQGRQVIALDGKGDRQFVETVTDAYTAGYPAGSGTIHVFPDQPLDGWRGDPAAQVNRLLGTWEWSLQADWYRQQATLALRLACDAPGEPVDSMRELVRRMDPPTLARLWAKHPAEAALVKMLTPDLPSIVVRLANLAAAIKGRLDGSTAIGETDLCVISLPTLANRTDSESLFRILIADVGHWISDDQRRAGRQPAFLVIDEFSAVSGARAGAIDVMERGRSFQVPSLLAGQSYASLGNPEEADRIVSAANTLALFASNSPDDLARLAGSVQTSEAVLQAEDGRYTGRASITTRARHRVDPNSVRQLAPGQCVLISGGRAEKLQVIRAPQGLAAPRPLAAPPGDPSHPGRVPGRVDGRREIPPPALPRQGVTPRQEAPAGHTVDTSGRSSGRGHRSPPVGEEHPPTVHNPQEVQP
jgi:hypothetical protein